MPSKLSPAIPEPQAGDNLPPSTLSLGIESQALDPCPRPKSYPFSYGPNGKSRLLDARLEESWMGTHRQLYGNGANGTSSDPDGTESYLG